MRRREFIALLGGAAAGWPLAARAQQAQRMRRLGVLTPVPADHPEAEVRYSAFRQAFQELGWTEGKNVQIEWRWSAGDVASTRKQAAELAALEPDVVLATGSLGAAAILQATRSIPVVFVIVPDPVGAGFVNSLAEPGGNATGFVMFEYDLSAKWPELLKEIAPNVTRAAVLRDAGLTAGDIIVEIDKKPVKDVKTLNSLLAGVKEGQTILFLIDRGGTTIFVTLNVKK